MAYCDITDVEAVMQRRESFSSDTEPTDTEVNDFIDKIDAQIKNACRQGGYVLPISGTDDLKMLNLLNSLGAAALASNANLLRVSGSTQPAQGSIYHRDYKEGLDELKAGTYLQEATETTPGETINPRSRWTEYPSETKTAFKRFFTRGKKF